jgi:hypothetical protein
MDHRAVRLALGLTIAGASMLTAGVASWLITAVGGMTSGPAARDLRLAALALLAGGVACGVAMGFALTAAGRTPAGGRPVPGGAGPAPGVPGPPAPVPSLAEPRSLMNPPPPAPPPPLAPPRAAPASGDRPSGAGPSGELAPGDLPSGDPQPAARVWWRAARSPASSWDDTSEEWLRSLRGPAIQQPPPHSAE